MTDFFASAASVHWMTPPSVTEPTQRLFGGAIDLDPCAAANPRYHYAAENWRLQDGRNGLTEPWVGPGRLRTFLVNPPFGASHVLGDVCLSQKEFKEAGSPGGWTRQTVGDWARKVTKEVKAGASGIWISKAAVETADLQVLMAAATVTHFPRTRTSYVDPSTGKLVPGATFPSMLLYFGLYPKLFREAFPDGVSLVQPEPLDARFQLLGRAA